MEFKSLISRFTIYQYASFLLAVLALSSAFFYGFGASSLTQVIIAILTASILDLSINYFKSKTWSFPQSALISGLFIGGLLAQGLQWHVYAIAGVIAVLSKHLIKFRQKHVFNPAIFGVLAVSLIFNASHSWWVSSPLALVLIFGIFIAWRLRRIDLTLSFLISYYLISSVIGILNGAQFSDIYLSVLNGGVIYFFSMFMLTEPRTNPMQRKQRIAYGIIVAVLLVLFNFAIPQHDLPLALAAGNIFVPVLNKMGFQKKVSEAANA